MKKLMIYGASGYTGRMVAEHAKSAGMSLVLAGRNATSLTPFAAKLGMDCRIFALEDAAAIDEALQDVGVILNCAGPFIQTADILMKACIRHGIHYLDVAAEFEGYQLAEILDPEARVAGSMLLPGSGGSVAMLGCLAGHAIAETAAATTVRVAMHVTGSLSRGSAISAKGSVAGETLARVHGKLVAAAAGGIRSFDFGHGPVDCFQVTLPDVITIWHATKVANIETFVRVAGDSFPQGDLSQLPEGPGEEERLAHRYQAAVEVTDADGRIVRAVLDTVNGYTFTAMAAAEAARRVLAGEARPGFQAPADLFGNGFAQTIADTTIADA